MHPHLGGTSAWRSATALFERALEPGAVRAVFQPVVRMTGGDVVGYEALARIDVHDDETTSSDGLDTSQWFELAASLGRSVDLEVECWRAIARAGSPPEGRLLFVNTSARGLSDPRMREARELLPPRVVLELSEQDAVADYEGLRRVLADWTVRGDRLAIDDTGSGYASLRHVLQLAPDFLKLDRSLIAGIDHDSNRRALVCALVAYAREAGAALVAEGIERGEEITVLREAGVGFAQGYLIARPGPAWPVTAWSPREASADPDQRGLARLRWKLGHAADARAACEATAEYLARTGELMPSVYLERGGILRCQAQRGLWQVLDGMPPEAGITGRTFRTGERVMLDDAAAADDYLEAIPGVVSEACEPIRVDDAVVGALNIESFATMGPDVLDELRDAATLLGERLRVIGWSVADTATRRLARHAATLADVTDRSELPRRLCEAVRDVSGMDSALLALATPAATDDPGSAESLSVTWAEGPLAPVLSALDDRDLARLDALVDRVASCYSAGDATGVCFTVAEGLRSAGVRAVVVLPLTTRGRRRGFLLVADTSPLVLHTEDVEPLELLAAQASMCLETAELVDQLRTRAQTDPLTGLPNHSAFHTALEELAAGRPTDPDVDPEHVTAVLMIDLDDFKAVNDTAGHLAGDQVLRAVAAAMSEVLRGGDRLFRVGGDEFAALLPSTSSTAVDDIGRRLCRAAIPVLEPYGAGLSIGAAILDPDERAEEVLERADRCLYDAKRTGGGHLRLAS